MATRTMTDCSWETFKAAVDKRLGPPRALSAFVELTRFTQSNLTTWKNRGYVPIEAMDLLSQLDPELADQQRFKGYHAPAFYKRVVELSNEGLKIERISDELSREFARKITINAVKAARFRNKSAITSYGQRRGRPRNSVEARG